MDELPKILPNKINATCDEIDHLWSLFRREPKIIAKYGEREKPYEPNKELEDKYYNMIKPYFQLFITISEKGYGRRQIYIAICKQIEQKYQIFLLYTFEDHKFMIIVANAEKMQENHPFLSNNIIIGDQNDENFLNLSKELHEETTTAHQKITDNFMTLIAETVGNNNQIDLRMLLPAVSNISAKYLSDILSGKSHEEAITTALELLSKL